MSTKFFTNKAKNTLFNKLTGIFEHNQNIKISAETAQTANDAIAKLLTPIKH
jgi:hypothetical protein